MPQLKACKGPDCGVKKPRDQLLGPMKDFCSVGCGYALSRLKQRQKWKREAKEYRAKDRVRKSTLKDKVGPAQAAQDQVNRFIAIRDHHKPCIVHGFDCPNVANGWDAGHFRAVGAAPELRFNTWNIHKQCRSSNRGAHNRKRYRASVDQLYEARLVERIGQERVDWLKGPHQAKQYREQDFKRIAKLFRQRAKHYKKLRGIE